jgi:hypothetical protein
MGQGNTPTAIQPWTRPQIFVVSRSAEAANNSNASHFDMSVGGEMITGIS